MGPEREPKQEVVTIMRGTQSWARAAASIEGETRLGFMGNVELHMTPEMPQNR